MKVRVRVFFNSNRQAFSMKEQASGYPDFVVFMQRFMESLRKELEKKGILPEEEYATVKVSAR